MKLKSFGCSFIFGTDLHDNNQSTLKLAGIPSNFTWPALLAKKRAWNYACFARPGSGNLQILEQLLNQLVDVDPAVYVVAWTWVDRFDYVKVMDQSDTPWPIRLPLGQKYNSADVSRLWKTIVPVDTSDIAETYYKILHNEYRDKLTTLIHVKTAIDALKTSGNQFIMTYMDDLMFDTRWNTSPAVSALQQYCKPYMTQFDGKNFLDFSREKGFKISTALHPLEPAHESAAELIDSYNLV